MKAALAQKLPNPLDVAAQTREPDPGTAPN
jgi:hypothetical protein